MCEGLILSPASTRVRLRAPAAEGAIHTGYDVWGPVDFYVSELRDRWLAGEVKGVMQSVALKDGRAFQSFNIVPVGPAERPAAAARHRERLLVELRAQYKDAVVRAITTDRRKRKRLRHAANQALGGDAPALAAVDAHFAAYPEALAAVAPIAAMVREVAAR